MASPSCALILVQQTLESAPRADDYPDPWFHPDLGDLTPGEREWVDWMFPGKLGVPN